MNFFKKSISALLCAVILAVTLASCGSPSADEQPTTVAPTSEPAVSLNETGYTLAYRRTDSLNPYECESQTNRNITTLMFDPLFNVNNDFSVSAVVAESYSYTKDNVITVKIRQGLTFTDATALTPEDVVYSFVLAKKSDHYSDSLKNVVDGSADGNGNVVFTLKKADPYEVANLCFPIIKKDSDKDSSSSDDYTSSVPVGSGRYSLVQENEVKKLVANSERLGSYIPKYSFIGLKDITEDSSLPGLFELNEISFYTEDFSEGVYKRFTGASTAFETTNFIFLGINSECSVLNESKVRRALSLLADRGNIAAVSFSGRAEPTATPFHPSFYALKGCSYLPPDSDEDAANTLLDEAGFTGRNLSDVRYSDEGGTLEIRLLVNKDNEFKLAMARNIQQTFETAGVKVVLKEYSYGNYIEAVKEGSYDIYIGEIDLPESLNLNAFFTENGGASFGIDPECKSAEVYAQLLKGEKTMQEFLDTFADELPFIPLMYRKGITVRSSKIKTEPKTVVSDYLYNIHEWTVG